MREVALVDLDQMSQDQGLTLATAVADLLIRSGTTRDDVPLSGPQLLQFLSELGDHLAAQRVAADATERDDAFEEAIVGLCNLQTDKDSDRATEAVGIARLRLDRKKVVVGKGGVGRVKLGGWRNIKKKTNY